MKIGLFFFALVLMLALITGCGKADKSPTPTLELKLTGAVTEVMSRETFESGVECHRVDCEIVDKTGNKHSYSGIPLWLLVGLVDDAIIHREGAFNDELASEGYNISVISGDVKSVNFNSTAIARNYEIIVANAEDGQPLTSLKLVGPELEKEQIIENVVEIHLDLQPIE
ncbi:MAG: hypothetical protein IMY88_02555 [Chloroflexi bacterium]|nr:hypothetical protein [Chloroflexota bacterium]